jgi:hypothetical protein
VSGQVWLGDVIRAVAALTPVGGIPDRDVLRSVSALLGLGEVPVLVASRSQDSRGHGTFVPTTETSVRTKSGDRSPTVKDELPPPVPIGSGLGSENVLTRSTMRALWSDAPAKPWRDAEPLDTAEAKRLRRPLPHTPLLRRRTAAAIVHAMVATPLPTAEVAVDTLVDLIATGKPVTSFPSLVRPSLRFGAHVLLDRSEEMYLFHRDQQHLETVIRDVVGKDATRIATFTESPLRMRKGTGMPEKGRPVVVVSAFGISSHPVAVEDWQRYVAQVRDRGSRVVALVPFARYRWPQWLLDLMPAVTWDRTSTVGSVRAALDRAS